MNPIRRMFAALLAGVLVSLGPALSAHAAGKENVPLQVFAAASLTDVLGELSETWEELSGVPVKLSLASSSVLARQIEAGARVDVFISADQEWMDYLQSRNLIDKSSRREIIGNRLVLIAPADSKLDLKIAPGFRLATALGNGRLSTGDPDMVPVGRYARSALTSLGVWDEVAGRLVRADNVRSAMMFVARGEVPLGIVYATDALIDPQVRIVDTFPASTHAPITYPAAAMYGASSGAKKFLAFLGDADAAAVWRKFGFREIK